MNLEIKSIPPDSLMLYASVPITFQVRSQFRVTPLEGGLGGLVLVEEPVLPPYVKDYDVDESPITWPNNFDVRNWAFFLARVGNRPVGAVAAGFNTPGIHMLEGRQDLVVVWDIRVHPEFRGKGVGSALFHTVEQWGRERKCRQLKVETQNINVKACRFYAAQGCTLGAINCYGYSNTPYANEVMLLWYKDL